MAKEAVEIENKVDDRKPVCPHCGSDPLSLSSRPGRIGRLDIVFLFCGNNDCRKVFNVHVMGVRPPMIVS